jgi:hypothetical protein
MFSTTRTPRSLLAVAAVAMAALITMCEALPLQMNLPARSAECLYEYADAG